MGWPSQVSIHCGLNSIHFIVKLFKNEPFQIDHQSLEHVGGACSQLEYQRILVLIQQSAIFVKHSISANFSIINDKNNGKAAHSLIPIATFIEVTMLTAQVLIFVRSDASEQ